MKSRIRNQSQRRKGRRKTALPLSNYTPELPLTTPLDSLILQGISQEAVPKRTSTFLKNWVTNFQEILMAVPWNTLESILISRSTDNDLVLMGTLLN